MNLDLIIAVSLGIVLLGVLVLRTHSALMIMATCAGFVLSTLWGGTVYDALINFTDVFDNESGQTAISVGLFLLPPLLIGLHFRHTQNHRMLQQIVPAVFWVAYTSSMTVTLLPARYQQLLSNQSHIVFMSQEFLSVIVLVSILVALVEFMSEHTRPRLGRPRKH